MDLIVIFVLFYTVIVCVGFTGNGFILAAIIRYSHIRTPFYIYLANVAVSDLLFLLLSIGHAVEFMSKRWPLGEAACKLQGPFIEVSYTVSCWTLAAVSLERYVVICRPRPTYKRLIKNALQYQAVIWVIAFIVCSPLLDAYTVDMNKKGALDCSNRYKWKMNVRLVFYSLHTFFVYVLPLILMGTAHTIISRTLKAQHPTVKNIGNISEENLTEIPSVVDCTPLEQNLKISYTSERQMLERIKAMKKYIRNRRVVRILIVIVVVFFILWCPFVVIRLLRHATVNVNELVYKVSQMLILTTTAVNFFIYAFISKELRRMFRALLCCTCQTIDIRASRMSILSRRTSTRTVTNSLNKEPDE